MPRKGLAVNPIEILCTHVQAVVAEGHASAKWPKSCASGKIRACDDYLGGPCMEHTRIEWSVQGTT